MIEERSRHGGAMAGLRITNGVLGALDDHELARLQVAFEPMRLTPGDVLCEPGQAQDAAVFPSSGVVSLNHVMANGASTAVALVGNEGLVGVSLFLGGSGALIR